MAEKLSTKYGTNEEVNLGKTLTVTAFAGGGQASATATTTKWVVVTTCATDEDSVKLMAALIGSEQNIHNDTDQILAVYPVSGEKIGTVENMMFRIAPRTAMTFKSTKAGIWTAQGSSI